MSAARTRLVCACAALCLAADVAAQDTRRLRRARVQLEGPLEHVELAAPGAGRTHARVELLAGERRELELALVPSRLAPDEAPRVSMGGTGRAEFLGWIAADAAAEEADWARLSFGLRARPAIPAPDGRDPKPAPPGILVAVGAFLLAVSLRARPGLALAAGGLGAAAVLLLGAPVAGDGRVLRVVEVDAASPWALEVLVARGSLDVPSGWHGSVATRPPGAAIDVAIEGSDAGDAWRLSAPGAELVRRRPLELPPASLARDADNDLAAFEELWVREPNGTWAQRGAWLLGTPLPPALEGSGEPPGWIQPALPQGTGVLVGRLADPDGLVDDGLPRWATWVRWTGF